MTHERRERADQLRKEEAEFRAMGDALHRESDKRALEALEIEDQLRNASLPPPRLIAVGAPDVTAIARSADPDAVDRAAVARTEIAAVRRATEAHERVAAERHEKIRTTWQEERAKQGQSVSYRKIDKIVADKLGCDPKTVARAMGRA